MYTKYFYSTEEFKVPEINYSDMDNVHVSSIKKQNVATLNHSKVQDIYLFALKDVEAHVDNNGLSSFWMMKGTGHFCFTNGDNVLLNEGDIILFNDHQEHAFKSDNICLGLSLMWDAEPSEENIQEKINYFLQSQNYTINTKRQKKLEIPTAQSSKRKLKM